MFPDLPEERFEIIYADPPWKYRRNQFDPKRKIKEQGPWIHYPVLELEELKQLDVPSIAADDCILFMWTTGPQLETSIELGTAWGFTYTTLGFVWEKGRPHPGYYTLVSCEFVLVFKYGRIPQPRGARDVRQLVRDVRQLVTVPRTSHSTKPHEVRRRIELMFPKQKKIELFARTANPGWTVWGNDSIIAGGNDSSRITDDKQKNSRVGSGDVVVQHTLFQI